jgi:hypothetical protein
MTARTERSRHKSAAQAKPHQERQETRQAGGQEAQAGPCAQGGGESDAEDTAGVTETAGVLESTDAVATTRHDQRSKRRNLP